MDSDSPSRREQVRQLVRAALEERLGAAAATEAPVDESVKDVITEADVRSVPPGGSLLVRGDAIITPAAQDLIRDRAIAVSRRERSAPQARGRLIAVGADHGGYEMKEQLKTLLAELGYRHRDFGTNSGDAVDYPDFAHAVARAVADGACDLGIIIDGAGIGSCMTANKVPGVRAALCYDEATARNSREHNFANVLTLGGKMISPEEMRAVVRAWLSTDEGEERHRRRVAKLMAIERQYLR
ncbi:MAG TPA: RpiB/LacA/LacB family sugar-phosphate isomerase [Blastocatellia bacterium]|nr:RpiB/LacA/LacB family sugar-phosphate isomerase [Blastocatellia bacterium]